MIKSFFSPKQKTFKDRFVEAAAISSGDKQVALDMTYSAMSILSRMLHRLYRDFAKGDVSEKAARTVATVASVIVLSMQRELEPFDIIIDEDKIVAASVALILTSLFNKEGDEVDRYFQYGLNAYKVILSNYGRNDNVKTYFNNIYHMTINYIDTHDDQYLDSNRHIVIR